MEDESRPLPAGWVRQFDPQSSHQFFVDTRANPPRSIWHHPYDDEQYLSTLSSEERERIESESIDHLRRTTSHHDMVAESSDEEDAGHHNGKAQQSGELPGDLGVNDPRRMEHPVGNATHPAKTATSSGKTPAELPKRQDSNPPKGMEKFGRKMKDKMTGTTHEQRKQERLRREEEERRMYEQHMVFRRAMQKAMETGQPQLVGKDKSGKDVYIEPPQGMQGYGGYQGSSYNPYVQGPYAAPGARYVRPAYPYQRPYGYGYGGGLGVPLAGGLLGGMLLGGALGGFGGGF